MSEEGESVDSTVNLKALEEEKENSLLEFKLFFTTGANHESPENCLLLADHRTPWQRLGFPPA